MKNSEIQEAFVNALTNPRVIKLVAELTEKQITENRMNPKLVEEKLVKKHVVFATSKDEEGAAFLTNAEVIEKVREIDGNEDLEIKTRSFGKALARFCKETKQTNRGRAYLIKGVFEQISAEDMIAEEKEVVDPNQTDLVDQAEEMEKETPESETKDSPVADPPTSQDLQNCHNAMNGFDDKDHYIEYLTGLKRKKLIKHINQFKMQVLTEDLEKEEIVSNIVEWIEFVISYHTEAQKVSDAIDSVESESSPEEQEKEPKKEKKKKDKKGKKKKKKKDKK